MKKFIIGSILYFLGAMSAFSAGYYEQGLGDCDPAAMRRAMDSATARTGAGITVVRCDMGAPRQTVAMAAPVRYVVPAPMPRPIDLRTIRVIDADELCCDYCF